MTSKTKSQSLPAVPTPGYASLVAGITGLLDEARRTSVRAVNALMTATYWEIGRRVVEYEQRGEKRAGYGEAVLNLLSSDLAARYGKGFSERNIEQMRLFYLLWPIPQTLSAKSGPTLQTVSGKSDTTTPSPLRSVAAHRVR